MTHVSIRHDAIRQLCVQMRESFESNGPLRVAVDTLIPDRRGASVAADDDRQRRQRAAGSRVVEPMI